MLSTVDLDLYINKAKDWFEAKRQDEETCYANASAAVLHLAVKCIIHVKPGGRYPDFFELRRELFDIKIWKAWLLDQIFVQIIIWSAQR